MEETVLIIDIFITNENFAKNFPKTSLYNKKYNA